MKRATQVQPGSLMDIWFKTIKAEGEDAAEVKIAALLKKVDWKGMEIEDHAIELAKDLPKWVNPETIRESLVAADCLGISAAQADLMVRKAAAMTGKACGRAQARLERPTESGLDV